MRCDKRRCTRCSSGLSTVNLLVMPAVSQNWLRREAGVSNKLPRDGERPPADEQRRHGMRGTPRPLCRAVLPWRGACQVEHARGVPQGVQEIEPNVRIRELADGLNNRRLLGCNLLAEGAAMGNMSSAKLGPGGRRVGTVTAVPDGRRSSPSDSCSKCWITASTRA